jgi:hypothetical protein
VQFYATRQPITLSGYDLDLGQAFEMSLGAPNDWDQTLTGHGEITRAKGGNNIGCPNVGKDTLRAKLPPGWALVEVAISSWLPAQGNSDKDLYGGSGDTVVTGGYTLIPRSSQTFDVQWGVLRTHSTSFHGNDFGWNGNDGCLSDYNIDLTVVGPAGLRPF